MITVQQFEMGLSMYIDREIANKTNGLSKWVVSLLGVALSKKSNELIAKYRKELNTLGYMSEDGMIDDDKLFPDLLNIAREKGEVLQTIPMVGTLKFNETDIDALRRYTHEQ